MRPFSSSVDTYPPVERILALKNPISKNGLRGERQLQDLVGFSELPFDVLETDREPDVTGDRLLDKLEETDILYVIGGDGTVNVAIEPAVQKQALLLPTRSGNANDLAMSTNGRLAPWRIYSDYLRGDADATSVHPIEVTIDNGKDSESRYAINYSSFGYAALASLYINQPWQHPSLKHIFDTLPPSLKNAMRLPREGYLLAKAAAKTSSFDYCEPNTGEGDEKIIQAADVTVVHSERMAKLGRFNVRHTDPFVFSSLLTEASVVAIGQQFINMMHGKIVGKHVTDLTFRAVNNSGNVLYYQVDGEAFPLPNSSTINIGLADSTLRVLNTRFN